MDWDFPALADAWNLLGLPALLVVVGAALVIRDLMPAARGSKPEIGGVDAHRTTVRTIALIHLGLAIRAAIGLAQELMTLRVQGIPQSFPVTGLFAPAVAVAMNLVVGHGLWHLRRWGRRVAIGWDGLVAILAALIAGWQWKYHAAVRLDQWPDYLVSDALPWFLLVVMLLPRTRAVFATPPATVARERGRPSPLAWTAVLLLLIVASTVLVDAAGWAASALAEMGEGVAAPGEPSP